MSKKMGRLIKKRRLMLGYAQDELAMEVGVSQQYISLLEKGAKTPSVQVVKDLAEILGIAVKDLMRNA